MVDDPSPFAKAEKHTFKILNQISCKQHEKEAIGEINEIKPH